ncbi:Uncharacterized membrane protein [Pedobacter steynii]|uniref:Uncharacterized membrane protein n=1 Tax=Pedobacter steynii TaxID=430522 RepID=A0A1G9YLZ6_9SPHI|nr:c-type cytochrome domain-containing protein [Pedobacter steynii]NQX39753.1 hypothetical protein [Pedobacter steynii]SDN09523.1 Uncharacterized membrane protein [Pedobacter steynii]
MMLLSISDLIGRFHPILVHLPIGILLLGCLFQLISRYPKFSGLKPAIPLTYLFGFLGAVCSCISGYLLSQSGDYDAGLVDVHQWLGIGTAAFSLVSYVMIQKAARELFLNVTAAGLLMLITLTGHYGGSLTHGSDYLTSALTDGPEKGASPIPPVANVQQAMVYTHMVQPLLKNRCYSCHGAEKQKGKLRLDSKEFMLKGGEEGKALIPGSPEESALIKRLLLPISNEDHMPPKEKPQLSAQELALLEWWIKEGADLNKKVQDLKQTEKIKPVLLSFQTGAKKEADKVLEVPVKEVGKADAKVIADLKAAGVVVIPVISNSNYLSVSFVTAKPSANTLTLLKSLNEQLIWLNLANTDLGDKGMEIIAGLKNLVRINLTKTQVTDQGLVKLKSINTLQYLNLTGTKITGKGLLTLKGLKEIQQIYLYQSAVNKTEEQVLKKEFPKVILDFGGYLVPTTAKDTTEVKPATAS